MFDKGKREQRHEQEDAAFNKMLLWLAGAVAVELLLILVKRIYTGLIAGFSVMLALNSFFHVFSFLGAALTAAGIVWIAVSRRGGKRVAVPCICASVAAGLWVLSVLAYYLSGDGMDIMLLLPAVGAVLIVVFFLYQRVFFFNAMLTTGGLLLLWLHRKYFYHHPTAIRLFFAVGFVLLAAGLALSLLLYRGRGKLGGLRVLPPDTDYRMSWITCALTALSMVLALVLGSAAGLYLLFALAAWVFIQAVFYTVQLM